MADQRYLYAIVSPGDGHVLPASGLSRMAQAQVSQGLSEAGAEPWLEQSRRRRQSVEADAEGLDGAERGLLDAPVYALPYRDIRAIVSRLPAGAVEVTAANVLRHEQVIESLTIRCALLPVRFGTILADEERLQALLAARYEDFTRNLARVAGKVEMGVRVLSKSSFGEVDRPAAGIESDGPGHGGADRAGHRYLIARLAEHRLETARQAEAERVAAVLDAALTAYSVEVRRSLLLTPHLPVSLACLVPRESVTAYLAEVERLRTRLSQYSFLSSGPWPPYNFVGCERCWTSA